MNQTINCLYCQVPCPDLAALEDTGNPRRIYCSACEVLLIFIDDKNPNDRYIMAVFKRKIGNQHCTLSFIIGKEHTEPQLVLEQYRLCPPKEFGKNITPQNVVNKIRTYLTFL